MAPDIKHFLEKSRATLQSNGYSFANFRSLDYSQAVTDVLSNEQLWNNEFSGFRFPYTMPSFWGFQTIDVNQYHFESSIGANNLEFIHGSVVPHNLAFSGNGFYTASDMLEIAPTYHDDYFFLKNFKKEMNNPLQQQKMVDLYADYLENYWEKAVKPYNGVMVYQGHPAYVAFNDTTIVALEKLIDIVKSGDTWIASIDEIADFRGNLSKLKFYVDESRRKTTIKIKGPEGVMVSNVSLKLNKKAESAESRSGKVILNKENSAVTFDAFDGQIITIFR